MNESKKLRELNFLLLNIYYSCDSFLLIKAHTVSCRNEFYFYSSAASPSVLVGLFFYL
jgi:hypothetical protein